MRNIHEPKAPEVVVYLVLGNNVVKLECREPRISDNISGQPGAEANIPYHVTYNPNEGDSGVYAMNATNATNITKVTIATNVTKAASASNTTESTAATKIMIIQDKLPSDGPLCVLHCAIFTNQKRRRLLFTWYWESMLQIMLSWNAESPNIL